MHDPIMHMQAAERHLEELRTEAAIRRAMPRRVPGWRRLAGQAMVSAGHRLLAEPRNPQALRRATDCD